MQAEPGEETHRGRGQGRSPRWLKGSHRTGACLINAPQARGEEEQAGLGEGGKRRMSLGRWVRVAIAIKTTGV